MSVVVRVQSCERARVGCCCPQRDGTAVRKIQTFYRRVLQRRADKEAEAKKAKGGKKKGKGKK